MSKNNARLVDPHLLIEAGIDPKTGLPIRIASGEGCNLQDSIRKLIEKVDEQNAVNRFTWYNLPNGLTPQLIERVLYYKGQGMLFKLYNKYFFLPYCLNGPIDVYGRYIEVSPLPFNGTQTDGDPDRPWIQGLTFKPVYDIPDIEEFEGKDYEEIEDYLNKSCILLHDYVPGISQRITPRSILQSPIISMMSECLPFMRTALLNSTGVMGMRVGGESEEASVKAASSAINKAALNGEKYVGIVGTVDFQELTGGQVARAEEFLLAMQSLDNFRLSMYGLDSGGLFQKKSHMLEAEQEMNAGNSGLVMNDSLNLRQDFCILANLIFGESMWVEAAESVLSIDRDGDGEASGGQEYARGEGQSTMEGVEGNE